MSQRVVPCAASSVLAALLDSAADADLVEAARTRVSVHYETGRRDVPVLCVCTPDAVRLPNAIVTTVVPRPGPLALRADGLESPSHRWRVGRWWEPPRPRDLTRPRRVPDLPALPQVDRVVPGDLVGAGPGLTPAGDDVLAGALVAAHAVADPRLPRWTAQTRTALSPGRTTAVSQGLLRHATDGWSTPELAAFVETVCAGGAVGPRDPLLTVGHTSGRALAAGVLHVLADPTSLEGAA